MSRPDVENYAREIARTLKPGGRAAITFFIMNDESERLIKAEPGELTFLHKYRGGGGGVRVQTPVDPEAVVAYSEKAVRRLLKQSGLTLTEPIHFGSWCGRQGTVTFQDLTLSERKLGSQTRGRRFSVWRWLASRFSEKRLSRSTVDTGH